MYILTIESQINDVPCIIGVTVYEAAISGRYDGAWEDCYPDVASDISFDVLKLNERPYPWLEKQVSDADYNRICNEIEAALEA